MMTEKDRVRAALSFKQPGRVPRDLWPLPYVSLLRQDELATVQARFPGDIGRPELAPRERGSSFGNIHMQMRPFFNLVLLIVCCSASPHVAVAANAPAANAFQVSVEAPGRISAAVYDTSGRLLRELLRGAWLKAGEHTLTWDGLDREGQPQPPGDYEWRVLHTPGFRAEYVTSLGIRPRSAPYDTWVGNHAGAASVAVDATGMYVAAQMTEGTDVILKQSLDGRQRYWSRNRDQVTYGRWQGGVSLASDGRGKVYMLQANGFIQVMNSANGVLRVDLIGRAYKGTLGSSPSFKRGYVPPERLWDPLPEEIKSQITHRHQVRALYRHRDAIGGADIAAHGDVFVITFRGQNSVRWLNPDDGDVVHAVTVPEPLGVSVAPDGRVYVISECRVLEVKTDGEQRTIVKGLVNPLRLAFDPADNSLLVVEGAPGHRVKRFSLTGETLGTYGREGGRLDGLYVPTDFLGVTSIAADGHGGFVVAEERTAPRRVARFDREGKLIDEWYGGQPYFAWGEPDPRDPTRVWFNSDPYLTLARIDAETGTWRVLENYRLDRLGDGLVRPVDRERARWRVLYHGNQMYLVSERRLQVLRHAPGSLSAVSVFGNDPEDVNDAVERAGYNGEAQAFRWFDRNGDGLPQPDEFCFAVERHAVPHPRSIAEDFGMLVVGSAHVDAQAYFRVQSTHPEWTEAGPLYRFDDEPGRNRVMTQVAVPSGVTTAGIRGVGVFRDREGNVYGLYNTGDDRHGTSWPTEWGAQSRLVKWDAQGRLRWRVGRHAVHGGRGHEPHTTPPGFIHVGTAIIGEVRDTIVMTDRMEWMGKVWTKDGLYVGDVLDGRVDDGLPDAVYFWLRTPDGANTILCSDNGTGSAIVEDANGKVWFFTQGRNSVPVYRIHGWDGWQRRTGTLTLAETPPHAARDGNGLHAAYYDQPDLEGEPAATRVERRIWHGIPRRQAGSPNIIDGHGFHIRPGQVRGPIYNWSKRIGPLDKTAGEGFSVRWTGAVEAPLTESFVFSIYARGIARLWLNGEPLTFVRQDGPSRWETAPVNLAAGQRYTLRLDFSTTHEHPAVSLNWESPSIDRQRIPGEYLYPER